MPEQPKHYYAIFSTPKNFDLPSPFICVNINTFDFQIAG